MRVKVTIEGVSPLLMRRYPLEEAEKLRRRGEIPSPEEECGKAMYRNEDGCYIPSTWISAMLTQAGTKFRAKGRLSYRDVMKTIIVEPEEIPLLKKTGERYETYDVINRSPVVVQRQRIVRSRPQFNSWKATFELEFDEGLVKDEDLRKILELGGKTIGLGDWRPKYGRFEVREFKVIDKSLPSGREK